MATALYTTHMFLWRWFKRAVFLTIVLGIAYVVGGFVQWGGQPARDRVIAFFKSAEWNEGVKDLRTWFGALLQLAGKKIEEGVTPADQQKLNAIIEQDLKKQLEQIKTEGAEKLEAIKNPEKK